MDNIETRRKRLYEKLSQVVDEFAELFNEEENVNAVAGSHILIVGMEGLDVNHSGVAVFPANGAQAAWKSSGLINQAKGWIDYWESE